MNRMQPARSGHSGVRGLGRGGVAAVVLLATAASLTATSGPYPPELPVGEVVVDFNGLPDGTLAVSLYEELGLHIAPHPNGGPYIDDIGDVFSFAMESPPSVLSLSPLAPGSPPGQAQASTGTYVFDFIDPTNRFARSTTDLVAVTMVFVDTGQTTLTAFDADGQVLDQAILNKGFFDNHFAVHTLMVSVPGIARATVTTPPEPTLGGLVDTLVFSPVPPAPYSEMEIDIRGPRRNVISLAAQLVTVTIYSTGGLVPADVDPLKVLLSGIQPARYARVDRNGDGESDLVVQFSIPLIPDLARGRRLVTVTLVDAAGNAWRADREVFVIGRLRNGPIF